MVLRKEKSIMILPANKRKATVMKDTGEYEHKVTTVLSDDKASDKLTQISYSPKHSVNYKEVERGGQDHREIRLYLYKNKLHIHE